jgi:arsenate reductase
MTEARKSGQRWYATPLDDPAAVLRARQLDALAEPDRLRVLSGVAACPDGTADAASLVAELGLEVGEVLGHIAVLTAFELLEEAEDRPGSFMATADTRLTTFSKETVERYVADSYRLLAERARFSEHLPSRTTRFVQDRLNALAVAGCRDLRGTPEALFVCVQNADRSQMAAALLRHMVGDEVHVRTAGSCPSGQVDPTVVEVLDEIGVTVGAEFPRPLTDEVVRAADFVITMGCGDACPIYPGRRYMDWPVADPIGQSVEDVRGIRDEIAARLTALCHEMGIGLGA